VFAEQIDELADRHAQATPRFGQSLIRIGLESGGAPGSRLARKLGIIVSGATVLRRLRSMSLQPTPSPVVIGVDDFALRRGQVYGTLFVDHQTHRVIDIIPDRSRESTTRWLSTHGAISIVTRDRSSLYAKGIRDAHPDAVQVADRWHLLSNAREALIRLLDRHHREINSAQKAVAKDGATAANSPQTGNDSTTPAVITEPPEPISKARQDSQARRGRRLLRYQEVLELRKQEMGIREIARELHMGRSTVLKFVRAGGFPEQARRHTQKSIDTFTNQIRAWWWDGGIHNAKELHRRIAALGFTGSWYCVRRLVAPWRVPTERCSGPKSTVRFHSTPVARISSKRLSWLLIKDDIARTPGETALIANLLSNVEAIRRATDLTRDFGTAVKQRCIAKLNEWMLRANDMTVPAEMTSFASGLQQDWPEVSAALEHPWSNGRAEGHVNRIKMIKRKMYGRANFDLLRIRVLASGP
jgi:transposase